MITASDRVALILGRAIIRAETLQAENEELLAQLAETSPEKEATDPGLRPE